MDGVYSAHGKVINAQTILAENRMKGISHLTLRQILGKQDRRMWITFIWHMIRTS